MRVTSAGLTGVLLIDPDVHRDVRGYLIETYQHERYRDAGIALPFVQDNQSASDRNTLRGLHLQVHRPQGKLVRVVVGAIFDVAVDVRRGSPTFGRWIGTELSADNFRQCYVPPGFAHGFCVTSASAVVEYKCTELYDPASEIGIAWDDPALGIGWPVAAPILSARDRRHPPLAAVADRLPSYAATNL